MNAIGKTRRSKKSEGKTLRNNKTIRPGDHQNTGDNNGKKKRVKTNTAITNKVCNSNTTTMNASKGNSKKNGTDNTISTTTNTEEQNTINQSNEPALTITNTTTTTVTNQQKEGTKTNVVEKTSNGECYNLEDVAEHVMKNIQYDKLAEEVAKRLRKQEREPHIGVGKVVMVPKQTEATMQGEGSYNAGDTRERAVSTITDEYGLIIDNDMLKALSDMSERVEKQLRDYVKKHWYPNMKFPINDKVTALVINKAVGESAVMKPQNIPLAAFCSFYRKRVGTVLTALRHNSQTLARKNWIGKYRWENWLLKLGF